MSASLQPRKTVFDKRHDQDDFIDEVRIFVRERYKTSGMSGDEWRFHRVIQLYRKGHLIQESVFNADMQMAASFLPWIMVNALESGQAQVPETNHLCFQPGCPEPATSEYEIIEEFGPQGQRLHDEESRSEKHRRFCQKHLQRGDCAREDCDDNYRVVSGYGPEGADMSDAPISPSARVDLNVGSIDEIPAALDAIRRERGDAK